MTNPRDSKKKSSTDMQFSRDEKTTVNTSAYDSGEKSAISDIKDMQNQHVHETDSFDSFEIPEIEEHEPAQLQDDMDVLARSNTQYAHETPTVQVPLAEEFNLEKAQEEIMDRGADTDEHATFKELERTQEIILEEKLPVEMLPPRLSDIENLIEGSYEQQSDAELHDQLEALQLNIERMNFILGHAGFIEEGKSTSEGLHPYYLMSKSEESVYLERYKGSDEYIKEQSKITHAREALYTELKKYFSTEDIEVLTAWGLEKFRELESKEDYAQIADIFMTTRGEYMHKRNTIEKIQDTRGGSPSIEL